MLATSDLANREQVEFSQPRELTSSTKQAC